LKFSIIITVFNNLQITSKLLKSIAAQSFNDYEVIIVDNSTKKQSLFLDKFSFKNYKYINSLENLLYSKSINLSFKETSGDFIIILNSDIMLEKNFLKKLAILTEEYNIQSASPVIYRQDYTIDSCGIQPGLTMRPVDIRKIPLSYKVFGPAGSIFIIKKSACLEIIKRFNSLMDEKTSFFYTDLAFAYRLKELNIETLILKSLKAYHNRGASTPQKSSFFPFRFCKLAPIYQKLLIKNRAHFLNKYKDKAKITYKLPFILIYNKLLKICLKIQTLPQRYKYKSLISNYE